MKLRIKIDHSDFYPLRAPPVAKLSLAVNSTVRIRGRGFYLRRKLVFTKAEMPGILSE